MFMRWAALERDARRVLHAPGSAASLVVARQECRVGWQWTTQIQTLATQAFEHRNNHLNFFAPEMSTLACMRIQTEYDDARVRQRKLVAQISMQDADRTFEAIVADRIGHRTQRQMRGRQRDT